MGKLLAGMLFALVVGFVAVPNAGAAEIPPTAKCVKTSKKLFRQYFEKLNKNDSDAAEKKADRELTQDLYEADCISDPEPLLKPMKPKPFSKQCVAAAKDANGYLAPAKTRFTKIMNRYERRLNPISSRVNRLDRRIAKLRSQGASAKRIRSIARVRRAVIKRRKQVSKTLGKKLFRFMDRETYPTFLILYELGSLRCLDLEEDFIFENTQKGPAAKVLHRNSGVIFMAAIYLAFKYTDFSGGSSGSGSGSSASASSLAAPPVWPPKAPHGEPKIPLVG